MKAKGKSGGTKAQIRALKEHERRISLVVTVILLTVILLVSGFLIHSILFSSSEEENLPQPTLQFKPVNSKSELKAAIVDHLSLTFPNETFVQAAANILTQVNYTVDYFSGEKVTVNFYKSLPESGYKLIIFRVHSGLAPDRNTIFMFTSEPYSKTGYVGEQLNDQVNAVTYDIHASERPLYFAVLPKFIKECAKGRFNDTVIILMGCRGLETESLASTLIEKGAKVYIGWNGSVSASHTDTATTCLLHHLITEKQTIKQAVENTMKETGPDPNYESMLTYYPTET